MSRSLERLFRIALAAILGLMFLQSLSIGENWLEMRRALPIPVGISALVMILSVAGGLWFSRLIQVRLSAWSRLGFGPEVLPGLFGGLLGLVLGYALALPFADLPALGRFLPALGSLSLGYLGFVLAQEHRAELLRLWPGTVGEPGVPKLLDTSVIIDGRIADICRTGFLEGPLVVPGFVLEELRHIADSSDVLKRNRGRRGLDILNRIRKEIDVPVEIWEGDIPETAEVDLKLLQLSRRLGGKVITNDYNLNKVAELQGLAVLNINDLANAVKPVVLPGEELTVQVIKEGKEFGQGVGYLDDGTMIVVDGGKKYIGENLGVLVTSVLQTSAGRMIFARPKGLEGRLSGS